MSSHHVHDCIVQIWRVLKNWEHLQDDKGSYMPLYNLPAGGARGRSRRRRIGLHRACLRDGYRSFEQASFACIEVAA